MIIIVFWNASFNRDASALIYTFWEFVSTIFPRELARLLSFKLALARQIRRAFIFFNAFKREIDG